MPFSRSLFYFQGANEMNLLIDFFGIEIPGYGLFIALGFIAVILYLKIQNYYKDLDFEMGLIILAIAVLSGGLAAKVLYWITAPADFLILFDTSIKLANRINYAFTSGFVFIGGLVGALLAILLFLKKFKELNKLMVFDLFAIAMPLFHMFGRMGCYMAGCCYGSQTTCSIGITFPNESLAPPGISLYPTQLFSVLGNFIITVLLVLLSRRNKEPGKLFALYLIFYSIGRMIIEFYRGDEIRGIYYGLSTSQWLSIPIFVIGISIYYYIRNKNKKNRTI